MINLVLSILCGLLAILATVQSWRYVGAYKQGKYDGMLLGYNQCLVDFEIERIPNLEN